MRRIPRTHEYHRGRVLARYDSLPWAVIQGDRWWWTTTEDRKNRQRHTHRLCEQDVEPICDWKSTLSDAASQDLFMPWCIQRDWAESIDNEALWDVGHPAVSNSEQSHHQQSILAGTGDRSCNLGLDQAAAGIFDYKAKYRYLHAQSIGYYGSEVWQSNEEPWELACWLIEYIG